MEEVDKIILHSLRQIGCELEDEVVSLKQFDSEMIVKAAVSCLRMIQPGVNIPLTLPQNMAARYRVGQDIAQACIDSGYSGDVGYQTFLYSGEADVRRVLMFLIEKLPKDQEKFVHEPTGSELLLKRIKCRVREEAAKPWMPYGTSWSTTCCSHSFISYTNDEELPDAAWKTFWSKDLPGNAMEAKHLLPTLITLHSRGLLYEREPEWCNRKPLDKRQSAKKFSEDSIAIKRKPPLAPKPKLKDRLPKEEQVASKQPKESTEEVLKMEEMKLTEDINVLMVEIEQLQYKKSQMTQECARDAKELSQRREKDAVRTRIMELLPEGEGSVARLQQIVEGSARRLVALAAQWEKHRAPLVDKYRNCVRVHSSKINETVKRAETTKSLGEKRKELELELRSKEKVLVQLQEEHGKNGKEANRSAYTRRILEIIGNIEKQKLEMEKVLRDTRGVQKEINTLSGQLDRSFTVADETIFRDAKKDEGSRRAYKLLATLHSDCDQLVAMVQETGAIVRESRDLEEQIEKEKAKNIGANLERITADLNQMKVESSQLSAQLKLKQKPS